MGVCNLFVLVMLLARHYLISISDQWQSSSLALLYIQVAASGLLMLMCLMVPRRPEVYRDEKVVDGQFTTSILGWISFAWIQPVIDKCQTRKGLTADDLAELDHLSLPENIHQNSKLTGAIVLDQQGAWRWILNPHYSALVCQLLIAVASSILSFAPQLALLRILRLLEDHQLENKKHVLGVSVIAFALSVLASAVLEPLKTWCFHNRIAVRVQQQLSLAIFDKTLRTSYSSDANDDAQDAHSPTKILSADMKKIVDVISQAFVLCESPIKIGIASIFLAKLLGWQSIIAYFVVVGLLATIKSIIVRRYSANQQTLMRLNGSRLEIMKELLFGLRQKAWESEINEVRDCELKSQWTVYFWQIWMTSTSSISPILLSLACITAYALSHGSLSASTAFTSISVLNSIQVALTALPKAISTLFDASNSVKHLTLFFAREERLNNAIPSDVVKFRNATISWPGARPGVAGTLAGLDLRFPKESLSIVTGPSGSGKSLLLTAMIDEANIVSGIVTAPVSAPLDHTLSLSEPDTWLSTLSLAYVSQKPWIQNATVQDNIRLGLPLDHHRYAKVIFACGLGHDLEEFPHGDQTVLSAKDANVSDDQKARISLARALYSRAKTLIVDDIFSVISKDAQKHIYQHVLCGDVMSERTFILATQNIDLYLPLASYLVSLEDGRLKSAITINEMSQLGSVSSFTREEEVYSGLQSLKETIPTLSEKQQQIKSTISRPLQVLLRNGGSTYKWTLFATAFIGYAAVMLGRVSRIWQFFNGGYFSNRSISFSLGVFVTGQLNRKTKQRRQRKHIIRAILSYTLYSQLSLVCS